MWKMKALVVAILGAFALASTSVPALGKCGGFGKGNNGFGNGGGDGVPGKSGTNGSPNAGEKRADRVR